MPIALVAFGSNVGDSRKRYRDVQTILSAETQCVELIRASQAIETKPIIGELEQRKRSKASAQTSHLTKEST